MKAALVSVVLRHGRSLPSGWDLVGPLDDFGGGDQARVGPSRGGGIGFFGMPAGIVVFILLSGLVLRLTANA